jgi:hypothetical protein
VELLKLYIMAKLGCAKCGGQKMKTGGQTIVGMPGYNATTRPMQMKAGGTASLPVCRGGLVRMPDGSCGSREKFKKGGATKNVKLAAVAPPKNKVTRADVLTRILKKKKK